MTVRTVSTKDELECAKNDGVDEIYVIGELAEKLKKAKSLAYAGAGSLAALAAAIAATPFTGGLSLVGFAPVAALTGVEIATIIIAASIGLSLIIAVFTGYEEVDYSKEGGMRLRKKSASSAQSSSPTATAETPTKEIDSSYKKVSTSTSIPGGKKTCRACQHIEFGRYIECPNCGKTGAWWR